MLARHYANLSQDTAMKLEPDGGVTFFTNNFKVCNRGGDYKNCKSLFSS